MMIPVVKMHGAGSTSSTHFGACQNVRTIYTKLKGNRNKTVSRQFQDSFKTGSKLF